MVRSKGIIAILTTLAATGLVWSQQAAPTPPKPDDPTGKIITITEAGKPPQKCKVHRWWRQPNGLRTLQVEDIDTKEIMTIVEAGPPLIGEMPKNGSTMRAVGSRIFHWGRSRTPPPGTPEPPEIVSVPTTRPMVTTTNNQLYSDPSTFPEPARPQAPGSVSSPNPIARNTLQAWGSSVPANQSPRIPDSAPVSGGFSPPGSVVNRINETWGTPVSANQSQRSPCLPPVSGSCPPSSPVASQVPETRQPPRLSPTGWRETPLTSTGSYSSTGGRPIPATAECGKQAERKVSPVNGCPPPAETCLPTIIESPRLVPSQITRTRTDLTPSSPLRQATATVPAQPTANRATVTIEKAQPGDWRQSWGETNTATPPTAIVKQPAEYVVKPVTEITRKPVDTDKPTTVSKKPLAGVSTEITEAGKKSAVVPDRDLPRADPRSPDPLLKPADYIRRPVEEKNLPNVTGAEGAKVSTRPGPVTPAVASTSTKTELPPLTRTSSAIPAVPPAAGSATSIPGSSDPTTKGGSTGVTPASLLQPQEKQPLGARSVLASGNVQYVPVPVVTLPDLRRMPPPAVQVPRPPQIVPQGVAAPECAPGPVFVNAFTPAEKIPPHPASPMGHMMANAFSSDYGVPPPNPGMLPAGALPVPAPGVYSSGPGGYPPMLPPGYGPALPANPYGPRVQMAMMPGPGAGGGQVGGVQGVSGQGLVPVGYQQGAISPAAGTPSGPNSQQLIGVLREALYPSQREAAVEKLGAFDWRVNEPVVKALIQAAKEDPAATVRAECARTLAKMKVNTVPVVSVLQSLKNDSDVRVRTEAEKALAVLAPELSQTTSSTGQPGSGHPQTPAVMPKVDSVPSPSK